MSPNFRTRRNARPAAESPERLYDDLPPLPTRPGALWAHQADVLRTYHHQHLATPDVALELPTGAGKTLPGLLITEWRRRQYARPVIYACPTRNLARQTARAAERVGLDCVTLTGRHRDWPTAAKVRYESAAAVAITTYSTLFNARPALEAPATVLFDDAHAAESYVAGAWSAEISRHERSQLYDQLLELLRPALSPLAADRLQHNAHPSHQAVHLVDVDHVRRVAGHLSVILRDLGRDDELFWTGETLGARLDRCLIYISWDAILIRPIVPPTSSHPHFTNADQRIYLSATLGAGGELERAFGRHPIARLPIPEGWDSRGAGRRFFVFPELQLAVPPRELAADVVSQAGKALVLTPSDKTAHQAHDLARGPIPVHGPRGDIDDLLDTFRDEQHGLLILANRYDGLDLPDAECRVTVLDGMPRGAHLQERFLSETLQAGRVLRERQRTRVVQGAGRCARGLSDYSIVIVLGDSLTRFLALSDVRSALRPDLQAEVGFGRDNSEVPVDELHEFVTSFLAQDRAWREDAEPALLDARRAAQVAIPGENAELDEAARHEVRATAALWAGDWATASRAALQVAETVRSPQLAGYRAFWSYLAAAWLSQYAEERQDGALRASAAELMRKAHAAGRSTLWLREVHPLPAQALVLDELDEAAVTKAAQDGPRQRAGAKWAALHTEILAGLAQTDPPRYEQALVQLGSLLGAEAFKPAGPGRTDCAWIWPGHWWLAIEAKSNQDVGNPISHDTVRQASDQLTTLAADREETPPANSAVLVVGPRLLAEPTAALVAAPFMHMTTFDVVLDLAEEAVAAWKEIRGQANGLSSADALPIVRRVLAEHGLLPSDIKSRLLRDPICG